MLLRLRPHHILCSIGFDGVDFEGAFTANLANVVRGQLRTREGRSVEVFVTGTADAICAPCPRRAGLGCGAQARIDRIDAAHLDMLGLEVGDRLSWGACLDRVRERVVPEDLEVICAGCPWLPNGMCKANLANLIATGSDRRPASPDRGEDRRAP